VVGLGLKKRKAKEKGGGGEALSKEVTLLEASLAVVSNE